MLMTNEMNYANERKYVNYAMHEMNYANYAMHETNYVKCYA